MADVLELQITDATEDELWNHGLSLDDALSVIDEESFRTFRDAKHQGRRILIGPDRSGRLLTLVIEAVDPDGRALLITGWPSSTAETTLFNRPGGSTHAGQAETDESRRDRGSSRGDP